MFPDRPPDFAKGPWTLDLTLVVGILLFAVICQVYRYRTVSTHVERLQVKWVILPLGLIVVQFSLIFILSSRSSSSERGLDGPSCR